MMLPCNCLDVIFQRQRPDYADGLIKCTALTGLHQEISQAGRGGDDRQWRAVGNRAWGGDAASV